MESPLVRKKQEVAVQVSTLEQSVVTSLGAGVKIIAFNPKRLIVQIPQEKTEEPAPSSADDFPYTLESFAEEVLRLTNEARAELCRAFCSVKASACFSSAFGWASICSGALEPSS